ncbi:predicted protein [Lichtheimia corymbifera JMRC:FSU:9682]|uniref:SUI1 domain-containing protein n=1 Tax=Lichtheimia corymbifera JMRC:FSU:9682 TaxID=1263082 RepID=A0A068RMQ3_9FUNG|nr:predicted protein [Lichtheimia corymbifera JMRC:FSU:9682]
MEHKDVFHQHHHHLTDPLMMKTTTSPVALFVTNSPREPNQRNGRKTWTIVQGLQKQFDSDKILKVLKKQLACNGKVVDYGLGQVVQLSGDQRAKVAEFLIKEDIANKEDIRIRGF